MINRTLLKTLSYAVMHMGIAIVVAYILSGSWKVALAIGMIEPCVQTVAYFFHERAWHRAEARRNEGDHHDEVIDSVSPVARTIDKILNHKH